MKMSSLKSLVLLSIAQLGLSSSAHAAPYTPGDIFLGFRIDGGTQDYLINIGQASLYKTPSSSSFTVSVGNIGTDLTAIYGAGWHSNAAVHWAVMGTNTNTTTTTAGDPGRTLYCSKAELSYGVQETSWNRGASGTQAGPAGKLMGLAGAPLGFAGYAVTSNSSVAVIQTASDSASYASYQPGGTVANSGGISFAYWNPSNEGDFGAGAGLVALDLFRMAPGSSSLSGEYLGTFTITSAGVLTFKTSPPVTSTPGFASWIAGFNLVGANAAASFDYDHDGIPNGVEYVQNSNPLLPNAGGPTSGRNGANFVFSFTRSIARKTADTTTTIQLSTTLGSWPVTYQVGTDTGTSTPGVTITAGSVAGTEDVKLTVPFSEALLRFARLRVAITP